MNLKESPDALLNSKIVGKKVGLGYYLHICIVKWAMASLR